ncbi:MAG: TetR family transcriptional regulator [Calditrichaeota bacterium]|nr:MAG: TetR family transcriptional regulator [Calditrichota bacterium]
MKQKSEHPTRQKILQVGAQLVRQKGFNNTGLQEILRAAGVPKGSFYFYFQNKEEFGLALIDVYNQFFLTEMQRIMSDKNMSGLTRLRNFFHFTKEMFSAENFTGGCPLGNLALEMGDIHPLFAQKISDSFQQMESYIQECLVDAQKAGEIPARLDAGQVAYFILNGWEGALVRMKVERSLKSLDTLEDVVFNHILKQ